tara:strand:- start:2055 stop:2396 length:342 start_codon:yes stop_codon:yes gene_type:complete
LVVGAGLFFIKGDSGVEPSGKAVLGNGEIQKVTVGMKNYNYYPNTIRVKAGQPVSLSLDSSVYGCFRDFTIRELGIKEYLASPKDSLEFTLPKAGTYIFACSMGMGSGTLIAE